MKDLAVILAGIIGIPYLFNHTGPWLSIILLGLIIYYFINKYKQKK